MVTTSMETKTSQNEPLTLNSNYITRYTTEQEKVSNQVSASETERRIGKCLIDLWKRLIRVHESPLEVVGNKVITRHCSV